MCIEWKEPSNRNKKDLIEIKKLPIGDEVSFLMLYLIYKKREFLIVMLEGSRTRISNIYISERKLEEGEQK